MRRDRQSLQRRAHGEGGFTLIEVIVAMVITVMVMTSLSYVVISSLKTIQQAKQRETATALATQELERLRALPYDTVTKTDTAASLKAGLLYATTVAGVTTFSPPSSLVPGVSEPLVINTVSSQWKDVQVDQVTYRVHTYVTRATPTASGSQPFNLTTIVQWTSSVWPAGRTSIERSTTFSPAGCLSTATSPFAAPCQAYVTARAGDALAGITVSDPVDSTLPLLGSSYSQLRIDLATTSSTFLVEQTANGSAQASTSAAQRDETVASGGELAKAAVDSDPSSTPDQSVTSATPAHTSGAVTVSGSGGTLTVRPSSADSGTARAAIGADGTICVGANGTGITTGPSASLRPCASSNLQTSGTPATLVYTSPEASAVVTLVSAGTGGAPSRSVAAVVGTANTDVCDGAGAPVDCVHAATSRSLGTATFAASSFVAAPAGFDATKGLWHVSGLAESARAEEGTGSHAPVFSRAGTLQVWNGTGYTNQSLSTFATPATAGDPQSQTWNIPETTVRYSSAVELKYSGSVIVQRPNIARSPATRTGVVTTDCKTDACTTSVDGSASVVGRVEVTVLVDGAEWTKFAVVTDLGGPKADVSYKAAPDGA